MSSDVADELGTTGPLSSLRDDYDVVVVGGGVNGLAIARDAAARGLSTLLLEKGDLGGATSNISSRLVHGGLKYLERVEVALVRESIREREVLITTAPHLVAPYPMLIPFMPDGSRPGWLLASGVRLHDLLSIGTSRRRGLLVSRKRLRERWPGLRPGARGGVLYEDAQVTHTERLMVEIALTARVDGADLRTHARVEDILLEHGRACGVRVRGWRDDCRDVRARVVVNAAGPWLDELRDGTRLSTWARGSHLAVAAFPGAPETCVFFEARSDQRPMFVMPWDGRYLVGTTDVPHNASVDEVVASPEEVDYLLQEVNQLIPTAHLDVDDVLWCYSGVRSLPASDGDYISREYRIVDHTDSSSPPGLVTIVGGKLTTHRSLAENVVDRIVRLEGWEVASSPTARRPFPGAGAVTLPPSLDPAVRSRLTDVYGSRAARVVEIAERSPDLARVLDARLGVLAAEIPFALTEGALTLSDVMFRRTMLGLADDLGHGVLGDVVEILRDHCGWSDTRLAEEKSAFLESGRRLRPSYLTTTT